MKQINFYCDICKKLTERDEMLNLNVFPKVKGHKASLGCREICKKCYKILFEDREKKNVGVSRTKIRFGILKKEKKSGQ